MNRGIFPVAAHAHAHSVHSLLSRVILVFPGITAYAPAQTFSVVATLTTSEGYNALDVGSLAQGLDGNFYGTALSGTIFQVTPAGAVTILHSFTAAEGGSYAGLILGKDGDLYGTAASGVFKISTGGTFTLFAFPNVFPGSPYGGVTQAKDGTLYGTTPGGGAYDAGAVFSMTLNGYYNVLHSFNGPTEGSSPKAPPAQGNDGNFYGTTCCSGTAPNPSGTVYEMTPAGELTVLYNFGGPDGAAPLGALIQASDGNFYGTTQNGGATDNGTIFKITPSGTLTTLYSFMGTSDGGWPDCALLQASDGNFYGTSGGAQTGPTVAGTIFRITPTGTFTTLHVFDYDDGSYPFAGLIQATDGNLYGITSGTNNIFRLTLGGTMSTLSVNALGTVNNASFAPGSTPLAAGTIAAVFGSGLDDGSKDAFSSLGSGGKLITSLGGASVTFSGVSNPVPIFSAFPQQLNVEIPQELGDATSATIQVTVNGHTSAPQLVPLGPYSPGIFTIPPGGTGQGAIQIANSNPVTFAAPDGSIPGSLARPAKIGEFITIFCTGLGGVTNTPATGEPASDTIHSTTIATPDVMIGGVAATVSFSGLAPTFVGLYQVNVQVPRGVAGGDAVPLVLSIGGVKANPVTVAVAN